MVLKVGVLINLKTVVRAARYFKSCEWARSVVLHGYVKLAVSFQTVLSKLRSSCADHVIDIVRI